MGLRSSFAGGDYDSRRQAFDDPLRLCRHFGPLRRTPPTSVAQPRRGRTESVEWSLSRCGYTMLGCGNAIPGRIGTRRYRTISFLGGPRVNQAPIKFSFDPISLVSQMPNAEMMLVVSDGFSSFSAFHTRPFSHYIVMERGGSDGSSMRPPPVAPRAMNKSSSISPLPARVT